MAAHSGSYDSEEAYKAIHWIHIQQQGSITLLNWFWAMKASFLNLFHKGWLDSSAIIWKRKNKTERKRVCLDARNNGFVTWLVGISDILLNLLSKLIAYYTISKGNVGILHSDYSSLLQDHVL